MHIVEKNYLGLELKRSERTPMLRKMAAGVLEAWVTAAGRMEPAVEEGAINGIWYSFVGPAENYLFTVTAQQVVHNIKVAEAFDIEILRVLPANKLLFFNFLLGKDRVVKCMWSNDHLVAIDLQRREDGAIQCQSAIASLEFNLTTLNEALVGAIQCLIFLRLTEPEFIHVAAGKKYGTRKSGHYNASSYPVTVVDSTWNQYIVRTEGFGVSGHFRMQRHGKENAALKLVWIKPYQKHGYVRAPKAPANDQ